ncbi:hypothetical protein GUJ93_ZPchr0003g17094 [Zizania palustris]|uniref:Uncharacterized protein n=1 Tax=Zizania palustris TaxID=103762 RepID=A0A8J5S948_ZIZPA|nr:hypothetical protein GUJ93_ZPchr0003g17094 [Zizania palustris]
MGSLPRGETQGEGAGEISKLPLVVLLLRPTTHNRELCLTNPALPALRLPDRLRPPINSPPLVLVFLRRHRALARLLRRY